MGERRVLSELLKESILQLCKASVPTDGELEIDGIVCITVGKDTEHIVVKVHEKILLQEPRKGSNLDDECTENADSKKAEEEKENIKVKGSPKDAEHMKGNKKNARLSAKINSGKRGLLTCTTGKGDIVDIEEYDAPGAQFTNKEEYMLQQGGVNCEYCQMVMVSMDALVVHWHSAHNAYVCHECCKPFMKRPNYVRHMKMHENRLDGPRSHGNPGVMEGVWRCGICEEEHTSDLTLVQHMQTSHDFEQQLSCCLCQECFPTRTSFIVHRRLAHANVKDIMCTACEVGFQEFELELHNKECDGIQYMTAASSLSTKRPGTEEQVSSAPKKTKMESTVDAQLPEILTSQNLSFQQQRELFLSLYEKTDHNDEDSDKPSSTSSSLEGTSGVPFRWHQPISDESPSPPYKRTSLNSLLKKIPKLPNYTPPKTRIMVTNGRHAKGPFRCGLCDMLTLDIVEFTKHNMEAHWRHVCQFCAQTFATRRNVKRHMRKHTGEQPYTCHLCNKSFYRDDDLRRHKTLHDKPAYLSPRPGAEGAVYVDAGNRVSMGVGLRLGEDGAALPEGYLREDSLSPECGAGNENSQDKCGTTQIQVKAECQLRLHTCTVCSKSFYRYKDLQNHEALHGKCNHLSRRTRTNGNKSPEITSPKSLACDQQSPTDPSVAFADHGSPEETCLSPDSGQPPQQCIKGEMSLTKVKREPE